MSLSGKGLISGLLLIALMACSGDPEPQDQQAAQEADTDHVWKEQVKTIDRAKQVEQTIKDADAAKRKAIEDADGG